MGNMAREKWYNGNVVLNGALRKELTKLQNMRAVCKAKCKRYGVLRSGAKGMSRTKRGVKRIVSLNMWYGRV